MPHKLLAPLHHHVLLAWWPRMQALAQLICSNYQAAGRQFFQLIQAGMPGCQPSLGDACDAAVCRSGGHAWPVRPARQLAALRLQSVLMLPVLKTSRSRMQEETRPRRLLPH